MCCPGASSCRSGASNSGWRSPGRWPPRRGSSSSMSPSPTWTPSCGRKRARSCAPFSRVSGAGRLATLGRIVFPLLVPLIVSGWILKAAMFVRELSLSVVLFRPGTEVLAVQILRYSEDGLWGRPAGRAGNRDDFDLHRPACDRRDGRPAAPAVLRPRGFLKLRLRFAGAGSGQGDSGSRGPCPPCGAAPAPPGPVNRKWRCAQGGCRRRSPGSGCA